MSNTLQCSTASRQVPNIDIVILVLECRSYISTKDFLQAALGSSGVMLWTTLGLDRNIPSPPHATYRQDRSAFRA